MTVFGNEVSLRAFPKFQLLGDHIQSIVLRMLKDARLNSYGGLKRPPNAWLIFRSDMLAANAEMSSMSQAEVTIRCKSRWAVATLQERIELQARARRANDELLQYFPDYSYKPMSTGEKARWKELGTHLRKDFWLSSATRIAERIAYPDKEWDGFLTLEKWVETHTTIGSPGVSHKKVPAGLGLVQSPETGRASGSTSPSQTHIIARSQRIRSKAGSDSIGALESGTDPLGAISSRFHPYNRKSTHGSSADGRGKDQPRIRRKATTETWPPGLLRNVLVRIGSQASSTQRRRLVLSMFQLMDKLVWVSEEVDDAVPGDISQHLSSSMSPDETSPDHLVLHDYTDPWIPEAMDNQGELFQPEIESISEYYEYMSAYYIAQENSMDFIWPPHPLSLSPSLSPPSPHEPLIESSVSMEQATKRIPSNIRSSNPSEDSHLDFRADMSPPGMCESVPSTNLMSDSDSDSESVTTPEEDIGWDESVSFDSMEEFNHEGLEGFEFDFEQSTDTHF
ncbi:unnamed protein product [Rhizoctonia solani]|nr:unnamed protein product [Rhizoctonia solani]